MGQCLSCGAEITFAETEAGKQMPLERDANGDHVIVGPRTVGRGSRALRIQDNENDPSVRQEVTNNRRFKSHFASCPQAPAWRKDKNEEPAK